MLLVAVTTGLRLAVAVMWIRLESGSLLFDGIPADMTCKTNRFIGNFSRSGLTVTSVTLHIHLCMFAMELYLRRCIPGKDQQAGYAQSLKNSDIHSMNSYCIKAFM